jgi:hypothetical protein
MHGLRARQEPGGRPRSPLQGEGAGTAPKLDGDPVWIAKEVILTETLSGQRSGIVHSTLVKGVPRKSVKRRGFKLLVAKGTCPAKVLFVKR